MVRRRPCASRFARARLVAVPAVLGQAAPGGVVARLVAAPAVLGPVVPDAVPRSDSSPCPCGSSGRRRCARPRRSHGRGGEPVPAALLVRTAAPGRGLRPGRGIITRPARAGVEIAGRPARSCPWQTSSRAARRSRESGRSGARWDGDRARADDDSRTDPRLARVGPRPAETGTGLRKLQVRSTGSRGRSRCGPGAGLRNASPARHRPPRLAPCEPSATESARARSARAHLAQCEPR